MGVGSCRCLELTLCVRANVRVCVCVCVFLRSDLGYMFIYVHFREISRDVNFFFSL